MEEALRRGEDTPVPYAVLDLEEREESLFLATFDPISAMAEAGQAALEELLGTVQTGSAAIQEMLAGLAADAALAVPDQLPSISDKGWLYNAGDGHEIHPFKLAYRLEAAWRAEGVKALDLYSGQGQLAAWYRRRFAHVVTVDKAFQRGDVNYSMTCERFIDQHLTQHSDFTFVDFDDEGCPAAAITQFMQALKGERSAPFVLALTDGGGTHLRFRGTFNPATYMLDGEKRQATREDYERFEEYVTTFVKSISAECGFAATQWSTYWKHEKSDVVYQTWFIEPASIARPLPETPEAMR